MQLSSEQRMATVCGLLRAECFSRLGLSRAVLQASQTSSSGQADINPSCGAKGWRRLDLVQDWGAALDEPFPAAGAVFSFCKASEKSSRLTLHGYGDRFLRRPIGKELL